MSVINGEENRSHAIDCRNHARIRTGRVKPKCGQHRSGVGQAVVARQLKKYTLRIPCESTRFMGYFFCQKFFNPISKKKTDISLIALK